MRKEPLRRIRALPAAQTLDMASVYRDIDHAFRDKTSAPEKVLAGFHDAALETRALKDSLVVLGGQALMSVGGLFGEENSVVEYGRSIIQAGARNLDRIKAENERNAYGSDMKRRESLSYMVGGGVFSLGGMLLTNYLTGGTASAFGVAAKTAARAGKVSALAFGAASEASGEVQEGIETYRSRTGDAALENYTAAEAGREAASTGLYTAGATALESLNLSKLFRVFKPKGKGKVLKAITEGALTEGVTEAAQEGLNVFIDKADGTIKWEQVPERLKGILLQGAVGSIVGGGTAGAFSVYHRARGINAMEEYIGGTVEDDVKRHTIAAEAWDDLQDGANTLVAKELIYDESLRNKHGDIYNAMQRAIARAADESGAFADADEAKRAQYIDETARMFADQTLAEANQRGVSIDEVLKSSDIGFYEGGVSLDFGSVAEGTEGAGAPLEQAMFKTNIQTFGEFYDAIVDGTESRPIYMKQNFGDVDLDVPSNTVRHDVNKHGLTKEEFEGVFAAINEGKITEAQIGDYSSMSGTSVKMVVDVNGKEYGVVFEAMPSGRNLLQTVFVLEDKGWINKKERPKWEPFTHSLTVVSLGHSLPDIISEVRTKINSALETEQSTETDGSEKGEKLYQADLFGGGRGRGYIGKSMSVNMAEAQKENRLPASKAAKALGVSPTVANGKTALR